MLHGKKQKKSGSSRRSGGMMVGGVSILAIFAVLCLAVFSTLSLVSAETDLHLSEKNIETIERYYQADFEAEKRLAGFIPVLTQSKGDITREGENLLVQTAAQQQADYDIESRQVSFEVPVTSGQALSVIFEIQADEPYYKVLVWKVVHTQEYHPDHTMKVWDGES